MKSQNCLIQSTFSIRIPLSFYLAFRYLMKKVWQAITLTEMDMLAANWYGEVDTCVHSTPFGRCLLKREARETE